MIYLLIIAVIILILVLILAAGFPGYLKSMESLGEENYKGKANEKKK